MPVDRKPIFQAVQQLRNGAAWTQANVDVLDRAIDAATGEHTARFNVAVTTPPAAQQVPILQAQSKFTLSQTSLQRLAYVHPKLRQCIELAINYTAVDFGVSQTLRTIEQQKQAVATGHSRTMNSKHLKQPDGWVWAADLVAYIDSKPSWELAYYAAIAVAVDKAATEIGVAGHVRWGCAWDRVLSDFKGDANVYMAEVKAYEERHAGSDLLDGPHFEWVA